MKAQIFVAVLGCSNYTFVWASKSQKLEDWIEAHVQTFEFFGGMTESIVPDNLKSAVTKAGRDLELNRTYQDMARHYNVVILPARVRKPQDKAKAEQGVLHISRWILAPLRERIFFSVEEINQAIQVLLPVVNSRPFKDLPGNRQSRFEEIDRPALRSLPMQRFEYAEWIVPQKVRDDYHVKVMKHFYSVPFQLVGERVEARITSQVVNLYHENKRVASHLRSQEQGGATVDKRHMAPQHLAYSDQGLESYLVWAKRFGPATQAVVRAQYEGKRSNSFIANQACSALRSLARQYEPSEFEAACKRAQAIASMRLSSVKSILRTGLYKQGADFKPVQPQLPLHENIRGASYYAQGGL